MAQKVLETIEIKPRMKVALTLLKKELAIVDLQADISKKIEEKISKQQREFFLKEQLKAIKKYVDILELENIIRIKQIGASRLCLLRNKGTNEVLDKIQFFISDYLTGYWRAFDEVMNSKSKNHYELVTEIGKQMSKYINWPALKDFLNEDKPNKKEATLDEIVRVALVTLEMFNEFGKMLKTEEVPRSDTDSSKSVILRVEYRGGFRLKNTESFYYLNMGFLNEKLRTNFGDRVYLKILEIQKTNYCCYYELGIKN